MSEILAYKLHNKQSCLHAVRTSITSICSMFSINQRKSEQGKYLIDVFSIKIGWCTKHVTKIQNQCRHPNGNGEMKAEIHKMLTRHLKTKKSLMVPDIHYKTCALNKHTHAREKSNTRENWSHKKQQTTLEMVILIWWSHPLAWTTVWYLLKQEPVGTG